MAEEPNNGHTSKDSPEKQQRIPAVVNGCFEIGDKLGSGSYSDVYLALDKVSGERVAVKFEWMKAEKEQRLPHEARLYESLAGTDDAPRVRWWGTEAEHNVMVMDLLGPSLEDLFSSCGKRFSLKTVLMLAEQMIDRIEYVHARGIIHRDIKPNNFLMGLGDRSDRVYIMDFGLAKRYLDASGEHIPCCKKRGLTGTVRYTSLNVHHGLEPSRRDDLGAIGYVLMYFNRGRLPWQGISAKSKKTKQRKIGGRKEQVSHEDLCAGYPPEFVKFLRHCDSLPFADAPDYNHLRSLVRDVFVRESFNHDLRFDWMWPQCANQAKDGDRRALEGVDAAKERSRSPRGCGSAGRGSPGEHLEDYDSDEYEDEEDEEEEEEYEYEYESEEEEEEEEEMPPEGKQREGEEQCAREGAAPAAFEPGRVGAS